MTKRVGALLRDLAALLPQRLTIESRNRPELGFVIAHLDGRWRYVYFIHPEVGGWRGVETTRAEVTAALRVECAALPAEARACALLADLEAAHD